MPTAPENAQRDSESKWRLLVGWVSVVISAALCCFWAFWGIIENFHEGWYHESLLVNVAMMFGQYLSIALVLMCASLASVRWPLAGATIHFAAAIFVIWFFSGANPTVLYGMIALPLVLLGTGYLWGRPKPARWAMGLIIALPLLTIIVCGIEPAIRVSSRINDGDFSARHIQNEQVDLIWAPRGPGWPDHGMNWHEAAEICRRLSEDGTSLEREPVDIWRLPTIEEAVHSQHRGGQLVTGQWDGESYRATYDRTPDKETPLWNVNSKVIYWWTATEADRERALIIVYDGKVWSRDKDANWGYLGFRAVKPAGQENN